MGPHAHVSARQCVSSRVSGAYVQECGQYVISSAADLDTAANVPPISVRVNHIAVACTRFMVIVSAHWTQHFLRGMM